MKKLLAVGIILLLVGVSIPSTGRVMEQSSIVSSDGKTWYVGGSGPGNFSSIQYAVNQAKDGDTVFVYNGTYLENIDIKDKSINVIGEDKNTTIVINNEIPNRLDWIGFVFDVYASDVMIKGFTIREGTAGIHYWGKVGGCHENMVVSDCNFIDNKGDWGALVIRTWYTNNTTIENCYFDNKGVSVSIGGKAHTNITFSNCFFYRDSLAIMSVEYVVFNNCKFYHSSLDAEKDIVGADYLQFYNCTMDSENWIYIEIEGNHQIFENCTFTNCSYSAIRLISSHWALIRNCSFKGGKTHSKAITFGGVYSGLVEGCTIEDMRMGINMFAGRRITIKNCHFENNTVAFDNFQWSFNRFIQNNFINNQKHFNNDAWVFINTYENNYWDDWIGIGPYRVLKNFRIMSFLNWDWNPASEPYDI